MEENRNNSVIQNLIELGLTYHEALIYVSVMEQGEASAGVVLDQVKLHREQVYRALKRLVDQGYLTTYEKRKRAYFSAVDPSILLQRTRAKVALAEEVMPYLQTLRTKKPQIITVTEGEDALKRQLDDMLETIPNGGEFLVLGGIGQHYYKVAEKFYGAFAKKCAKRHIKTRTIVYEGEEDTYPEVPYQEEFSVKRIPHPGGVPQSTVIYGNKVGIDLVDPGNIAVITIENEKVAAGYRQTFEALWAQKNTTSV